MWRIERTSPLFQRLLAWDTWWCGSTSLPARYLEPFLQEFTPLLKIILGRAGIACCVLVEILGVFTLTVGLLPWEPLWILGIGTLLKLGSHLIATDLQSRSGALWQLQLTEALRQLRMHAAQVRSMLADRGLSEAEIASIQAIPTEIYNAEIYSYTRTRLLMIGVPVACACGLLVAESRTLAMAVLGLGILSVPLTEWYFRTRVHRVDEEIRVGRSTGVQAYLIRALQAHERLMLQMQGLQELPLVLFLVRFAFGVGGDLIASYFAITQGLRGLTHTLSLQRQRTLAQRAVEKGSDLLEALANPCLLIARSQWNRHMEQCPALPEPPIQNGVILQQFAVSAAFPRRLGPIDAQIPAGACSLLQAPSGRGKTLLLFAIGHLIDHTGDLFLVQNGHAINAHALGEQKIFESILIRQDSEIDRASRLVDLFRPYLADRLASSYQEMCRRWGRMLTEVVWKSSDGRLTRILQSQELLPWDMRSSVEELRRERTLLITNLLRKADLNLTGDKSYGSLSSGERRRVLALTALTMAQCQPWRQLIILDEPFANLDREGMAQQAKVLEEIENCGKALLIVSHRLPEHFKVLRIPVPQDHQA
ncbi:MAG: hypothetical protein ACOYKZ_01285 [Chlamydiia bacterium]